MLSQNNELYEFSSADIHGVSGGRPDFESSPEVYGPKGELCRELKVWT